MLRGAVLLVLGGGAVGCAWIPAHPLNVAAALAVLVVAVIWMVRTA